jgi:membrane peptidoglycan carboxypeptidase
LSSQTLRTQLLRNLAIAFAGMVVVGALGFVAVFAWFAKDLPHPDRIVRREGFATKIFDRDEGLLYEVYADQQRTPVSFEQIPDSLKKAVIAIEDKNFYKHGGLTGRVTCGY